MAVAALVSVTPNASVPMTAYFQERNPDLTLYNYLDGYLIEKTRIEGTVSAASMNRMFRMLSTACEDGADAILLTCTVFSKYGAYYNGLLPKRVICADRAMLEEVAQQSGRTAILFTNPGTVANTSGMYEEIRLAAGRADGADTYLVDGALEAASKNDQTTHDALIREKMLELDEAYDQIVLAQISMARAADHFSLPHARIYTSPESAYKAVMREIAASQNDNR